MAFEWKWQPTLDEELSLRAKAQMEGYRPLSNPSNNYGMILGNGAGPTPAQIAAAQMAGYGNPSSSMAGYVPSRTPDAVPAPVVQPQSFGLGGEGGRQRGAGDRNTENRANYGLGQAYTDNLQALQDEYNRNEARIAEIESKIASLKGQISDNAKRRDALDMALAANRAGIGDIGNSIAHQNAIETRKQQEFTRKLELARTKGNASDAEKAVIDAYTELAYAPDEKTQALAQFKVNQALEKYQKATGKPYGANPLDTPLGGAKAGDVATTLERAQGKFSASFDKNGRPTAAAKAEALKDAEGLPYTKDLQEWIDKVRNTGTQEEHAGKVATIKKKKKKAIEQAKAAYNKKNGYLPKDGKARFNGYDVEVKLGANGEYQYLIDGKEI